MAKPHACSAELLSKNISGRLYIVTGANSGIGFTTATQLAKQGATVILAGRSQLKLDEACGKIRLKNPAAELKAQVLDLADLASVRQFAKRFLISHETLDGLVNNAGIMNAPQSKTKDGFESQFGTNHLGHFLLTELLKPALSNTAGARVVCVSSCYHDQAMGRDGDIHFDDLHFENEKYDGWRAYAQSKLANLLHARELPRRWEGTGVTAISVHPGWVRTNLIRHSMPLWLQNSIIRPLLTLSGMIEPWEGTQTSLYALLADDIIDHNGEFYSQTGMYRDKKKNVGGWPLVSPNPAAHDDEKAAKLWELSERLVGLAAIEPNA